MAIPNFNEDRFIFFLTFAIGLTVAVWALVGDLKAHPSIFATDVKSVEKFKLTERSRGFHPHEKLSPIRHSPDLVKEHREIAKLLLDSLNNKLASIEEELNVLREEEDSASSQYGAFEDLLANDKNDNDDLKDILMLSATLRRLGRKIKSLKDKRQKLLDNREATADAILRVNQQLKLFGDIDEKHGSKNHRTPRVIPTEVIEAVAAGNSSSSLEDEKEDESEAEDWGHGVVISACTCASLILLLVIFVYFFVWRPFFERPAGVATVLVIILLLSSLVARYIILYSVVRFYYMMFVGTCVIMLLSFVL